MTRIFNNFKEVDSLLRIELGKRTEVWKKILMLCEWIFEIKFTNNLVKAKLRNEKRRKLVFYLTEKENLFVINSVSNIDSPSLEFWYKRRQPPDEMKLITSHWYLLKSNDLTDMKLDKLKELVAGSFNDRYGE